ncbi:alkaline phosphatase synthesis sensor protein PhoR [Clostridiales bacterium]|nr:alkaline phosphatase synthesis sensor protein PhoR [Clostridiales bacterium]
MKRKINIYMIAVVIIAVLSTALLVFSVMNSMMKRQILESLKTDAKIIMGVGNVDDIDNWDMEKLCVTIIDGEGTTDNALEYGNKMEILEAINSGESYAIRKSDTLNEDTFYYAERLADGRILSVAMNSKNLPSLFRELMPSIIEITIVLIALCFVITRVLTKKIIKPIEKMADDITFEEPLEYEELIPVVNMLKEQHENILNSARMRQEFSANVSHELKTPLTVISGYAELIENKMVDETSVERFAGEIHHHSDRLLSLIDDIIRLSELDSESMELIYEDVDLSSVVGDCLRILKEKAEQHDISIKTNCENNMIVRGNRSMLEELITNLANNAISYNKQGGSVWINTRREEGRVLLSVKDNGIGIPERHKDRVFERFYRVDKSRSKRSGGTGLGLAIVKHIAASHNAQIRLESEEGKGTEVKILF